MSTVKLVGSLVGTPANIQIYQSLTSLQIDSLGSGLLLSKVISKAWVMSSTSSSSGNETEFSSPEN